jgi:hypothetical protein
MTDYWVFEDKLTRQIRIHHGDCGACKGGPGVRLGGSQGPRTWHGAYKSYEEALRKAKQIKPAKGSRINCALCHPQYSSRQWDAGAG